MLKVANSVINASRITGVLPVANGGTGVTTSTGTGNTVLSASPTLSGDVTLSTGNLVIGTSGKGIDFTAAGSGTLTSYEDYTATSAACTGAITTAAVWKLSKVGNMVTLTLPAVTGTASTSPEINFGTAIPVKYRPAATLVIGAACIRDNGASVAAIGTIGIGQSNGVISIYLDGLGGVTNWTSGAIGGLNFPCSVSWTI